VHLVTVLWKAPVDLHDVIDLHREENVGLLDVCQVQSMRAMRAQVYPEPACALYRGRVGRTVRRRIEPSGTDPDICPSPAAGAQQLGGEAAPDDVSETDEHNRPGPHHPRREFGRLARGLGHPPALANARNTARHLLPEVLDHLSGLPAAWRYTSRYSAAILSTVHRSRMQSRDAIPILVASGGFPSRKEIRSAGAAPPPGGTRNPISPSRTTSGMPPTCVTTGGIPAAIASSSERGRPSLNDGIAKTSIAPSHSLTLSR